MGTGIGRQSAAAVVATGGVVRCVGWDEMAPLVRGAIDFEASGLEELPNASGLAPVVVSATLRLTSSGAATRLAARFVARRVGRAGATLVLRTVAAGGGTDASIVVAPIPIAELTEAAGGLVVPVGEPAALRYATPTATVAVTRATAAPALVARLVAGHRLFMGEAHCEGDAALVEMASGGPAAELGLWWALAIHESAVVADLLRRAAGQTLV